MRYRKIWWGSWWWLRELCEVPRCLLWRGLRCHCPMYNVSCIFSSNCLYFSYYMAVYFLGRPCISFQVLFFSKVSTQSFFPNHFPQFFYAFITSSYIYFSSFPFFFFLSLIEWGVEDISTLLWLASFTSSWNLTLLCSWRWSAWIFLTLNPSLICLYLLPSINLAPVYSPV